MLAWFEPFFSVLVPRIRDVLGGALSRNGFERGCVADRMHACARIPRQHSLRGAADFRADTRSLKRGARAHYCGLSAFPTVAVLM
ncbi:hypothetical protein GCM10010343_36250 [Streptomyces avidinii]|nr:hypothetical protein GCM10010343_36250 [Streptomyces avidinii]